MLLQSSKVDDCAFEDALFHAMAVVQCHLPLRQADEENRVFFYTPANEHSWLENVHLFDPEKTRRDFRDSHGLCYMFVSGRIFLKKKLGDRNFEDLSSDQENLLVGVYIYIYIYIGDQELLRFFGEDYFMSHEMRTPLNQPGFHGNHVACGF